MGPRLPATAPPNVGYASLPLAFEQNRGQAPPGVKFLARGSGFAVFFTNKEAVLSLERSARHSTKQFSGGRFDGLRVKRRDLQRDVLHLRWVGASPAPGVEGLGREAGSSNYLVGSDPSKWVKGVPSFSRVEYRGLYPGVDLVYYGNHRKLEFDIEAAPGADLGSLRLQITGER